MPNNLIIYTSIESLRLIITYPTTLLTIIYLNFKQKHEDTFFCDIVPITYNRTFLILSGWGGRNRTINKV